MASRGVLIVAQHPREPFRLPTFLPTPSTYPFPSSAPPTFLQTTILLSVPHPPSILLPFVPRPCNKPTIPPPALHPLPGHQPPAKPPSDIHRRVSSELIIKCIVVPARALQYVPSIHYFSPPTLPPPSRAISSPPPPPPPPSPPPPLHPSPISLACVSFTRADSRAAASSSGLGRCKRWRKGTVDKEVSVIEPRSRSNYTRSIVGEREDVADGGS